MVSLQTHKIKLENVRDMQNDFSNSNFATPFIIHAENAPGPKTKNEKKIYLYAKLDSLTMIPHFQ